MPDPAASTYRTLYVRYNELYDQLRPVFAASRQADPFGV